MTQAEFDRLVTLDVQRLVAKAQAKYDKAQAEYEAQVAAEEEAAS
jgi:hypothetical protein